MGGGRPLEAYHGDEVHWMRGSYVEEMVSNNPECNMDACTQKTYGQSPLLSMEENLAILPSAV